jgi:hypothetical protein
MNSVAKAKQKFKYSDISGTGSWAAYSKCYRRWRVVLRDEQVGAMVLLHQWSKGCGSPDCGRERNHGITHIPA